MPTEFIRGLYNILPKHQGCVLTIGNFDGVHKGHQALLDRLKRSAKQLNVPSLVITFEPQPLEFFMQEQSVPRLTRFREKFHQLEQFGIDRVLVIRFNSEFAALSSDVFIQRILTRQLGVKHIIVGDDFRYGQGRKGDVTLLKKMGQDLGFTLDIMPSVMINDQRISSTRIRQALKDDHQAEAELLLGRPYSMMGRVVYGNQLGRVIGFPTANIYLHRKVTPVMGVYIVRLNGLPGVANVGVRPTIGGTRTLLEVHLFNFNKNIYGQYVTVEFDKKLRDEERFDSLELLKEQIWRDAEIAREYFIKSGELPNIESEGKR